MRSLLFLIGLGCYLFLLGCGNQVGSYIVCEDNEDCSGNQQCVGQTCVSSVVRRSESSVLEEGKVDPGKESVSFERNETNSEKSISKEPLSDATDGSVSDDASVMPERIKEEGPEKPRNCVDDSTQSCYTGAPKTRGVGRCHAGIQSCAGGVWGPCLKQTLPTRERCGDESDNDCDGSVDEGCPCNYGGLSKGVCRSRIDKQAQCRRPASYSEKELCGDGKDNNCDGVVDEGCSCKPGEVRACGKSVGVCKKGQERCGSGGQWLACDGVGPSKEICDGKDNNCDGVVDEGCPCNYQGLARGVCKGSTRDNKGQCQRPTQYQIKDTCGDKLDNNCNGAVDERCACNYLGKSVGVCKLAFYDNQGKCQKPRGYATFELCDNMDNDCDGVVDNYSKSCKNQCGAGTQVCQSGEWQGCSAGPAEAEVCDGKDNDCDGAIDESCPCNYKNNAKGVCANARRDTQGICSKPFGYALSEICNDGKDNNCNGVIDEFCPCHYLGKNKGVCALSKRDSRGHCVATSEYSTTERCDGKDNNCDGIVDGQKRSCTGSCPNSVSSGSTLSGTQTCSNGQWGQCVTSTSLSEACGDGKDNNCNGVIDEFCPCNYKNNQQGVCAQAKRDAKGVCQAPQSYGAEVCGDNQDNDCDGHTDKFPSSARCLTTRTCRFSGKRYVVCGSGLPYCRSTSKLCSNSNFSVNPCRAPRKCKRSSDCQPCPGGSTNYECKSNYCVRK